LEGGFCRQKVTGMKRKETESNRGRKDDGSLLNSTFGRRGGELTVKKPKLQRDFSMLFEKKERTKRGPELPHLTGERSVKKMGSKTHGDEEKFIGLAP